MLNPTLDPTTPEFKQNFFTKNMQALVKALTKAFEPPEDLTISEWADKYRSLPKTSSSEPGPWRTSRFPFMKEIMDEISPQSARQEIVVMGGSQISKTESTCINPMLYYIDYHPCPILYLQKTIQAMERFSRQRLGPSIEATPSVFAKIGEQKSRDSANTMLLKTFPGGILILGGSNSVATLRSMPIQVLLADEIDSFEMDIEGEGDPVKLAVKRTTNFPRRKIVYSSTPGVRELSRIEPLFESGDQRYYHVPCPHCQHYQPITWNHLKWDNRDPSTVRMVCEKCKEDIPEHHKTEMLREGKWVAKFPGRKIASFHVSALYSPLGFYSWAEAVREFLEAHAQRSKEKLKVFVNTVLAETWVEKGKSFEGAQFLRRKENYVAEVPKDALILTAGADVQEDRIEIEVVGWGKNLESWSIDWARFMGDTEGNDVWTQLDLYLRRQWKHEAGYLMTPACVGVDSGHRAHRVYQFCKQLEMRRIFPVKGQGGWGRGLIDRPKTRNQHGVWLFNVFVDEVKSKIYSCLEINEPGPNYMHFPNKNEYDEHYFDMLTSERLIEKVREGRKGLAWELRPGKRNEALDARAYAIAALNILNPNFDAIALQGVVTATPNSLKPRKVGVVSPGVRR